MGGNALKNVHTRRYEKDEFFSLWNTLKQTFEERFPGVRIVLVESYAEKDSFGDMDVLIEGDKMPDNWHEDINKIFSVRESSFVMNKESMQKVNEIGFTTEMLMNKPYSFDFKECQIDMIPVASGDLEFASKYLSFNDLGNIMGKVYRRLGAKYAMSGLQVVPEDNSGQRLPNFAVIVTKDHDEALRFAGYDPDRFKQGFASIEEIYQYVSSSEYFNPMMFLDGNTENANERMRIRNRKNYREFIEWCDIHQSDLNQGLVMDHEEARARLFEYFPNAQADCDQVVAGIEEKKKQKRRFNGNLVKEITGVQGQAMGVMIEFMKSEFEGSNDFLAWLENQSDEQLVAWIEKRHQDYLTKKPTVKSEPGLKG